MLCGVPIQLGQPDGDVGELNWVSVSHCLCFMAASAISSSLTAVYALSKGQHGDLHQIHSLKLCLTPCAVGTAWLWLGLHVRLPQGKLPQQDRCSF